MLLSLIGHRPLATLALGAGALLYGLATHAQAPAPAATLRIEGLVATPRTFTAAELAALPHIEQKTTDKEGKKHVYRGIALRDLLHLAGAPEGKAIHGEVLADALVATSADGYHAVYALPEVDADFSPQTILVADQRDGQPLPTHDGPLQLIVPLDKKPARWVRQITALRVVKVQ